MEPTEKEIVEVLAKCVGGYVNGMDMLVIPSTTYAAVRVGSIERGGKWWPFSLDDMAIIEAEIERRGLYEKYYLQREAMARPNVSARKTAYFNLALDIAVDRQPAAIRARAAYEVLRVL